MALTNEGPVFSLSIKNNISLIKVETKFLDLTYADALSGILIEGADNNTCIVIDFINVTYIDSVVISTIVKHFINQRNAGHRLIICNTDKHVNDLLETTRLNKILDIAEDVKEAIQMAERPLTADEILMYSREEG